MYSDKTESFGQNQKSPHRYQEKCQDGDDKPEIAIEKYYIVCQNGLSMHVCDHMWSMAHVSSIDRFSKTFLKGFFLAHMKVAEHFHVLIRCYVCKQSYHLSKIRAKLTPLVVAHFTDDSSRLRPCLKDIAYDMTHGEPKTGIGKKLEIFFVV